MEARQPKQLLAATASKDPPPTTLGDETNSVPSDVALWGVVAAQGLKTTHLCSDKRQYTLGRVIFWNGDGIPGYGNEAERTERTALPTKHAVFTIQCISDHTLVIRGEVVKYGVATYLRYGDSVGFGSTGSDSVIFAAPFAVPRLEKGPPASFRTLYDIGAPLASGGFGEVFRALRRVGEGERAVKIMKTPIKKMSMQEESDLKRECAILRSLGQHPHLVRMHGLYEEDGRYLIVMDLVSGGDLNQFMSSHKHLTEHMVRDLSRQLCHGVAHLHSLSIAHRDIKPENILITRDVPPVLKIADFGISKCANSKTALKTGCGTTHYVAPEVANALWLGSSVRYDLSADCWSVGVLIFYIICDDWPWDNIDDGFIPNAKSILWEKVEKKGISRQGQDFLKKLLQQDPKKRMNMTDALQQPWISGAPPSPQSRKRGFVLAFDALDPSRTPRQKHK